MMRASVWTIRRLALPLLCCGLLLLAMAQVQAQSSLGIGSNEAALQPTGPFAQVIAWINAMQRQFYLAMTDALRAMRNDPRQGSLLIGLSFLYGILHAAGPGHGKAVISSYMVANETALRRGIALSFISSLLQAISAVVIVGLAFLVLRGSGISMNQTAHAMEVASFALVLLFGLWLLARKLPLLFGKRRVAPAGDTPAEAPAWQGSISAQASSTTAFSNRAKLNYNRGAAAPDHLFVGKGDVCVACGNAHIADPARLTGDFNWKTAWAAILSVGLRPCSGALIVLTFAMLNGLVLGGLLSVFAMAFGTFLTVAVLASLAVSAKNIVLKLTGRSAVSGRIKAAIEVAAALFIVLTGALLLSAALL